MPFSIPPSWARPELDRGVTGSVCSHGWLCVHLRSVWNSSMERGVWGAGWTQASKHAVRLNVNGASREWCEFTESSATVLSATIFFRDSLLVGGWVV